MLEVFLSPSAGRRVRFVLPDVALMSGALAARAEVSIEPTTVSLRHVDYAFAVEKSEQGVPVIHWETFRAQPRKVITQDRPGKSVVSCDAYSVHGADLLVCRESDK